MPVQSSNPESYDVAIVGGGMSGLTVAHQLGDKNVLLLEKESLCGERTVSVSMERVYNTGVDYKNSYIDALVSGSSSGFTSRIS